MFKELRYKLACIISPELKEEAETAEKKLSHLLCNVTEGILSKPGYDIETMLSVVEACRKADCEECECFKEWKKAGKEEGIAVKTERLVMGLELDKIRGFIASPQFGDDHYGAWGGLNFFQRKTIFRMIRTIKYLDESLKKERKNCF